MKTFICKFAKFRSAKAGSVAAIFAFSMIPFIGITGAAIDYSRASNASTKLKAAADSAVLAALKSKPSDDPVVIGKKVFNGNVSSMNDNKINVTNVVLTVNKDRTKARIKFEADVKMTIASILKDKVKIGGEAEATIDSEAERDIFFMVDNSLSMQFPIDPAKPIPVGSDGCIFSCHLTRGGANAQGVVTRLEAGLNAYKIIADKLASSATVTRYNAFTTSQKFTRISGPTTNKNSMKDALDLLAFESSSHFGEHMAQLVPQVSASPKTRNRIVIIMTDALEEHRNTDYAPPPAADPAGDETWVGAPDGVGFARAGLGFPTGTPAPTGFMTSCNAIKSMGATVIAIYTPNYGKYPSFDPGHQPNEPASRNALRNCASPDNFFVADNPAGLSTAIDGVVGSISKLRISK